MSLQRWLFGPRRIEDIPPTELAAAMQIVEYHRNHGHPDAVLKVYDGEGWITYDEWLNRKV